MADHATTLPLKVKVSIKRLTNHECSKCGMQTLEEDGTPVENVEDQVLQGRCLIDYPVSWKPGDDDDVHDEVVMKRLDLGRCDTCEMLTKVNGVPINNERTLMGRCLLCHPVKTNQPRRGQHLAGETQVTEQATSRANAGLAASAESNSNSSSHTIAGDASSTTGGRRTREISRNVVAEQNSDDRQDDGSATATVVTANTRKRKRKTKDRHASIRTGDGAENATESVHAPSRENVSTSPMRANRGTHAQSDTPRTYAQRARTTKKQKTAVTGDEDVFNAIEAAKKEPVEADLQEQACKLIKKHVNEKNAEKIVGDSSIEMIVAAMRNHRTNNAVTIECMWALRNIARVRQEEYAPEVAERGGIKVIIEMLQTDFRDAREQKKIVTVSMEALCHVIVATTSAVGKLFDVGGIDVVISTMLHYAKFPTIHESACVIIQEVADKYHDRVPILVNAGVFGAIVEGMKKGVSEKACLSLQNLLLDNNSRLQFVKEGGLEVLVRYVRAKGLRNSGKLESAASALLHLVMVGESPETDIVEGVLVKVIEEDGISAIQHFMERNHDVKSLQSIGCLTLNELIFDESSATKVKEAGCLPVILGAMNTFSNCAVLQEQGCSTLGNIFGFLTDSCNVTSLEILLDAMEHHPEVEGIQLNGCAALLDAYAKSPSIQRYDNVQRLQKILNEAASRFSDCVKDVAKLIHISMEKAPKKESV